MADSPRKYSKVGERVCACVCGVPRHRTDVDGVMRLLATHVRHSFVVSTRYSTVHYCTLLYITVQDCTGLYRISSRKTGRLND